MPPAPTEARALVLHGAASLHEPRGEERRVVELGNGGCGAKRRTRALVVGGAGVIGLLLGAATLNEALDAEHERRRHEVDVSV